ncbi:MULTISPECIES: sigma-70 family RNA polymerase sigma factor [unclassified Streptomyces]|uniref:sigma-70 family RNA polymerase sigma factor n=1 Tax=unclassified Streptomyces TaxID=2593676 RepID=UPI000DC7EEDB|nr:MULTISPECIES: sigma-70 family RNA polymerase sigma factor [unclassified Streptomyces]AWZ04049.1 sigma-70 family RNA polymerase sigma factor [Streptomyces sp. ICC4]AWZ12193.1 sigma-70 family RNA polymerase sigma factor [Streptomyces sp. ICC1]
MAADESTYRTPETLTEEQAGRMLAGMNEVIRAGEEMRALRAEMIKVFASLGWTQERIAQLTGMSQPAVSKQVAKHRTEAPEPPMGLSLDQDDAPWLEGRLWGLAEVLSEAFGEAASCTPCVDALARGRKRLTPQNVDALRRLVEADLREHRAELPTGCRAAYDEISRGLDLPSGAAATGPAAVRRSLAHRIQRDRIAQGA